RGDAGEHHRRVGNRNRDPAGRQRRRGRVGLTPAGCGVLTAGVAPLANVARHSLPRGACMAVTADDVVAFWREAGPDNWFGGGPAFDMRCRERFFDAHMTASRAELGHWEDNATGALALVLLLDQIPRNIFRGSAHVYATDPMARSV